MEKCTRKIMKKLVFLISIFLIPITANSANIDLTCSGKMGGQRILEEQFTFDMSVDDKTGNMTVPPSPTGCFGSEKSKLKGECSINQTNAFCTCESFWGTSFLTLSRSTAVLTIEKLWKDGDMSKGIFTCKKITKKVF
jgi:hypothetical protein